MIQENLRFLPSMASIWKDLNNLILEPAHEPEGGLLQTTPGEIDFEDLRQKLVQVLPCHLNPVCHPVLVPTGLILKEQEATFLDLK